MTLGEQELEEQLDACLEAVELDYLLARYCCNTPDGLGHREAWVHLKLLYIGCLTASSFLFLPCPLLTLPHALFEHQIQSACCGRPCGLQLCQHLRTPSPCSKMGSTVQGQGVGSGAKLV